MLKSAIIYNPTARSLRGTNLTGQHFSDLQVIAFYGVSKFQYRYWLCLTNHKHWRVLNTAQLHAIQKKGYYTSYRSPEQRAYQSAKERCNNVRHHAYKDYGARGIEFRFTSFEQFHCHIGNRPTATHSVERIDNSKHYDIGNVKWATKQEQMDNRRCSVKLTVDGIERPLREYQLNITVPAVYYRLRRGWCHNCIVSIPARSPTKCLHVQSERA